MPRRFDVVLDPVRAVLRGEFLLRPNALPALVDELERVGADLDGLTLVQRRLVVVFFDTRAKCFNSSLDG